ncbi:MAG: acetolactate synthase small subunit [Bacteroidales bacterium]|nr:acetolactate synthase small subunit [Bacteroidales bacterium]
MNKIIDEQSRQYTVTVFTEDKVGMLNRITIVFTRRHLNIDSLTTSVSEVKGVHRFTIVTHSTPKLIKKVVDQIEKLTEVLRARYYEEKDVIAQEIALYKISTESITHSQTSMEDIIRKYNARILDIQEGFIVIEKTGFRSETTELFEQLKPYGILQFARSGRVAITKPTENLSDYLDELIKAAQTSNKIRDWKLKKNAEGK